MSAIKNNSAGASPDHDNPIELVDLVGSESAYCDDGRRREAARREKSQQKYRQILKREAMKFSHSVQFNSVPEWTSHYINYSNLKKLWVPIHSIAKMSDSNLSIEYIPVKRHYISLQPSTTQNHPLYC